MPQQHFVFIVGTRAQLIKVAPVIVECEQRQLACTLLMTGQHVETMQDLLDEFGIQAPQMPAMAAKERATVLSLIAWLPQAYRGIIRQLRQLSADGHKLEVLVHGDTLSTVLGALAGRKVGARVVHLESGLTSQKIFDPFPEEISRRIVFRLSHVAMCPNDETYQHIVKNYKKCTAVNTHGNTILDAIRLSGVSRQSAANGRPYIVASIHRFQNIYEQKRFEYLINLLIQIGLSHTVKFVLHPATRKRLHKYKLYEKLEQAQGIELLPRLGYSAFLKLAAESACVLTDGGSNQEELAAIGVPTIVMRDATERSDGLGQNALMEGEVPQNLSRYIEQKGYRALEGQTSGLERRPSKETLDYLLEH